MMDSTISFILSLFCGGIFVVFFLLGLLFYLIRRPLSTVQKMQKHFGKILMLLAIHVLFIHFANYTSGNIGQILVILLVVLDVIAMVLVIMIAFKWLSRNSSVEEEVAKEAEPKAPVAAVEKKEVTTEDVKSKEEITADEDDDADETVDETDDEAADVKPLQNTSIEDLMFFQKVEALMAKKRLFSEPELSRDMIAAEIGTNRTYLVRSIKNATGKTFLEYITDLRTSYAATLLTTTNEPLDMIGTLVGFRSKSAYYRAFAAAFGCSPTEYRKHSLAK